ncbi:DUF2264 domain-containing protein [Martelella alba]|uniref:DUF2264 domain-containing protein n=1 Tax=Martelella alba TaxID=2590451 RepID=A0ABY2SGN1_9HYPH|nr:DUF2264 domain-containing protein [Martelella alba]TKI04318.1 DUF2264 domain-containing protein [Martelella alba]
MYSHYFKQSSDLSHRQQWVNCLNAMLASVDAIFPNGDSGIIFGATCAHYEKKVAEMEGLSRILWGLFPLLASGEKSPYWQKYLNAIRHGTDPAHQAYWGETGPYDQRLVEMAVYGLGLALLKNRFTDVLTDQEKTHLHTWLNQISNAEMPDSNWNYFAIMVQLGFKQAGLPWDRAVIEHCFAKMEAYYLGNGWYSDGPGRPKDYYISMAFHYYGLIYATLMKDSDAERAKTLLDRATRFAEDFVYQFSAEGPAVPFGRSLTYRFAQAAFWSAAAFAGLDVFTPGQIKGIIFRHFRWWLNQPIFDRNGLLTLGYAYPNLIMAEDYNSPGSPYWAFKLFLILALPEDDPFWQADEAPLPVLNHQRVIKEADQILVHEEGSAHVYMLTSGQLELNNYVNTEAKYTKFAYSSHLGFTIERGRYGCAHAACDSMLLLAESDGYYRGRRECEQVITREDAIFSRWSPWRDAHVSTWLIPWDGGHIRVHRITTARELDSLEGGFAVIQEKTTRTRLEDGVCRIDARNGTSLIASLDPAADRRADRVVTPPNSNIMFAEQAVIPVLKKKLAPGTHWLCCGVAATIHADTAIPEMPELTLLDDAITLKQGGKEKHIAFS